MTITYADCKCNETDLFHKFYIPSYYTEKETDRAVRKWITMHNSKMLYHGVHIDGKHIISVK